VAGLFGLQRRWFSHARAGGDLVSIKSGLNLSFEPSYLSSARSLRRTEPVRRGIGLRDQAQVGRFEKADEAGKGCSPTCKELFGKEVRAA